LLVSPSDLVPTPLLPPEHLLKPGSEFRREALRVAGYGTGNRAADVAGELVVPIHPPEPLHREEVIAGLVDHDSAHPAQRVPKHEVPAGLLVPVARQQKVMLKAKVLQAACNRGEELLQQRALRLSEVRASVWHPVIRFPTR